MECNKVTAGCVAGIFNMIIDCLAAIILINSSECMKRDNIQVVTEGIALGGEYEAIRMCLYGDICWEKKSTCPSPLVPVI